METEDVFKKACKAGVARGGKPLHFVLVGAGAKAEEFGDAAVEVAERVGKVGFLLKFQAAIARTPAGGATQVAGTVEGKYSGIGEAGGVVGAGGMGGLMVEDQEPRIGKYLFDAETEEAFGRVAEWPRNGDGVNLRGLELRDGEGCVDCLLRQ